MESNLAKVVLFVTGGIEFEGLKILKHFKKLPGNDYTAKYKQWPVRKDYLPFQELSNELDVETAFDEALTESCSSITCMYLQFLNREVKRRPFL